MNQHHVHDRGAARSPAPQRAMAAAITVRELITELEKSASGFDANFLDAPVVNYGGDLLVDDIACCIDRQRGNHVELLFMPKEETL